MDKKLLNRYRKYAASEESFAVLFVRQNLKKSKGCWIDIEKSDRYEMTSDDLHFKFVNGGLYKKIILPKYPSKSEYTINGRFDEHNYLLMVRAITWETAHKDISQQKLKRVKPLKFKITGVSYDKNRNNRNYFRDDAPPEIKALEKNLSDRTDPLWDIAINYVNEPEFVYKIKRVSVY
ncbi:MAG: hypothetical protein KZQ90_16825 [Candidatus Thiodiazotropha sp. (ex Codakia rugifera)]|nr:hypothetical protein [Candidatus Thiodiazotropha sp. (ex Codakia rugifera)]